MAAPVYIGDAVSAAGWRLAGAATAVHAAGTEAAALATARAASPPLVLLSAAVAASIDEAELRAALAAPAPLVLVVPDLQGAASLPDVASRLRDQLGLQT